MFHRRQPIGETKMHDIDQVRLETEALTGPHEAGPFAAEYFTYGEAESGWHGETGAVYGETLEMELASEMLEITNEAELDRFIGNLIKKAGGAIGQFVRSPAGQAIGGVLKGAAKKALPSIGSAIGGYFGGDTGAQIGGQLASSAGKLFGLELEGLSAEDREFELARRYVRFAGEALRNMAEQPDGFNPRAAAQAAAIQAAQLYAPGLLASPAARPNPPPYAALPTGHSGRWVRRGNKIVLYGI